MTDNLSCFSYNVLIANLHEMYSYFNKELDNQYSKETIRENYNKILVTMIPIIPHFASECLMINEFKLNQNWPKYDEKLLIEENVKLVVQFNGRKREVFEFKRDSNKDEVFSRVIKDEKLYKYFKENEKPKKIIFIKNKIINIIT